MANSTFRNSKRYTAALEMLYGDKDNSAYLKKTKPVKVTCPSEQSEQIRFVNWLEDKGIKAYSVPNGRSNATEGAKYRATGSSPGVPDICVPYRRKGYGALYLELKRVKGGVVSFDQKNWIAFLNNEGYLAVVAKGADEAIAMVEEYFSVDDKKNVLAL